MKLYTKRGDDGSTDLFGGRRVAKDSLRIAACGEVDETNAALGLAAAGCPNDELAAILRDLQGRLFELGADLATPDRDGQAKAPRAVPRVTAAHVAEAEAVIDRLCAPLPPMRHFILPGGTELSARLHLARAVCRRAERACVALAREERLRPEVVIYVNRLSDLLFAMARRANQLAGVADVPWIAP